MKSSQGVIEQGQKTGHPIVQIPGHMASNRMDNNLPIEM
jgi:hypothetical protein